MKLVKPKPLKKTKLKPNGFIVFQTIQSLKPWFQESMLVFKSDQNLKP